MPMSWTNVSKYYGLQPLTIFRLPYRRLAALALLAVFLLCASMFRERRSKLRHCTIRFFTYIITLLCAAAAFSRVSLLSVGILIWCTFELGLAISSLALDRIGIGIQLFPGDYFMPARDNGVEDRVVFHLLLQRIPKLNW